MTSGPPSSYDVPQPRTIDKALILAVDDTNRTVLTGTAQQIKRLLDPDKLPLFRDLDIDLQAGHIRATMNPDRVQCRVCDEWFFERNALCFHLERCSIQCEEHGHCFASHDVFVHAQAKAHKRCFVHSCDSKYRNETGWGAEEIRKHIREDHYPKRAER